MNYTIELSNGKKIPLFISNGSADLFCKRNGNLSYTGFGELFQNQGLSFGHLISLLFCCAEYYAKKNNLPFNYTEYDADEWLGDMGGILGEKTQLFILEFAKTLFPQFQGIEAMAGKSKGDKKK